MATYLTTPRLRSPSDRYTKHKAFVPRVAFPIVLWQCLRHRWRLPEVGPRTRFSAYEVIQAMNLWDRHEEFDSTRKVVYVFPAGKFQAKYSRWEHGDRTSDIYGCIGRLVTQPLKLPGFKRFLSWDRRPTRGNRKAKIFYVSDWPAFEKYVKALAERLDPEVKELVFSL